MNLYLYLPFASAHPQGCIKGTVYGLTRQFYLQNSHKKDYVRIMTLSYRRLCARGWEPTFIESLILDASKRIETASTSSPKQQHGEAVKWLGRYLLATRTKGTILRPQLDKDLEIYVDADFSGNYDCMDTESRDTARSRHGYIIMYKGCPLNWKSQLQTEICLSSTESEYTGLSHALREVIPQMQLMHEMKLQGFPITSTTPKVKCKVFEDNSGALEMATTHKYRPRTKHLNVKLHHFRDYVSRGDITIHKIDTQSQLSDYLTKPVNEDILIKLRTIVMGW